MATGYQSELLITPVHERNTLNIIDPNTTKKHEPNTSKDRQERAVAALLTRFNNLVLLAAQPAEDGATLEAAAAHAYQMEVETNALVQAAEDLLQLTRELKELWLGGPLRAIGEGESDGKMGEDSKKVGEMVEGILKRATELKFGNAGK